MTWGKRDVSRSDRYVPFRLLDRNEEASYTSINMHSITNCDDVSLHATTNVFVNVMTKAKRCANGKRKGLSVERLELSTFGCP